VTGLHLEPPRSDIIPESKGEWLIILGGASTVGQLAILVSFPILIYETLLSHFKIAKLNGHKVLASCSPSFSIAIRLL
jgi:hypothetical protein